MAELVLRLRDRELSRTPIRNTRITLGRDLGSDVVIDNPSVSRTHAILIYVDEKFRVRDDSANGMTVNGTPTKDAVLSYGDIIGIGKFELVLQQSAETAPLKTGGHGKANSPKNMVDAMHADPEVAAKLREEALAKAGGNRQSLVSAQAETLRPPPTKAPTHDQAVAAPAAVSGPDAAHETGGAAGESSGVAPANIAAPAPDGAAPAAATPVRKPRTRPKPLGVDVIAVLQLAGLGLLLIVGGLGVAWWMLEHGKL